jgi:hypothetical protein
MPLASTRRRRAGRATQRDRWRDERLEQQEKEERERQARELEQKRKQWN